MIFKRLAKFSGQNVVKDFMIGKFNQTIETLNVLMERLDFVNNFGAFQYSGTISAGEEVSIPHNLGVKPTQRIIVKQSGDGRIIDGITEWTNSTVYLQNVGSNATTVKVLFFKE